MNKSVHRRIVGLEVRHSPPLSDRLVTMLVERLGLPEVQVVREMTTLRDRCRCDGAIWDRQIHLVATQRHVSADRLRARLVAMGFPIR